MIKKMIFLLPIFLFASEKNIDRHEEILKSDEKVQRFLKENNLEYTLKRDIADPVYNLRMFLLPKGESWLSKISYFQFVSEFKAYMRSSELKRLKKIYDGLSRLKFLSRDEGQIFSGLYSVLEKNQQALIRDNKEAMGRDF